MILHIIDNVPTSKYQIDNCTTLKKRTKNKIFAIDSSTTCSVDNSLSYLKLTIFLHRVDNNDGPLHKLYY